MEIKKNNKELYEAPSIQMFEVKIEGVICESGGAGAQNYNWNYPDEE
ncbi:MAG: hypothetical protein J5604_07550 [Bacteroidales bacterium]|nr:hypothetical protein [Bacteroidales bacterium]